MLTSYPAKKRVHEVLRTVFHLDGFRAGQEEVIRTALRGRDVLALFPTGAGKSLCYQLPALLLSGPTLVVSPLIALMRDQVAHLDRLGIPALCLDSLQGVEDYARNLSRIKEGWPRLIYVSPERLQSEGFQRLCAEHPPTMLVVDEVHCVAQWGDSFRPAYAEIAGFIHGLPQRPVILAMTATADRRMQGQIAASLTLHRPRLITLPILRPNLRYHVQTTLTPREWITACVHSQCGKKGLIFCATRKRCERLAAALTGSGTGIRAGFYHAGMEREARNRVQEDYLAGRYDVLCVTSAFGMGVDIPDVSYTVHDSLPRTMLDLAQQTGRAGRDGQPADCVLLLNPAELEWLRKTYSRQRFETRKDKREQLKAYRNWRDQRQVLETLLSGRCIASEISACFGKRQPPCGHCSACVRRRGAAGLHRWEPLAPVPDLYHMGETELRVWALQWERKALARHLGLRESEVISTEALRRAARLGKLDAQDIPQEIAQPLERLLRALRAAS